MFTIFRLHDGYLKQIRMRLILTLLLLPFLTSLYSQSVAREGSDAEIAFRKEYEKNIKLTKIAGVYIPGTVKEAHRRISKLTPKDAIAKFKAAPEKEVCKKLHFGIGKWLISNWNFYGGSRISHLLKKKGVLHPDDMAQFLLRTFHRSLNDLELDEETLVEELTKERKNNTREAFGY